LYYAFPSSDSAHLIYTLSPYTTLFRSDFFNLALDQEGNVYSWGYNTFGQLGTGDKSNRYLPYKIPQLKNIKDIICDGNYAAAIEDRKSTRLNSSHVSISYAVFCLKKKI